MLILFDHATPKGIARVLVGHTVTKAKDCGWDTLSNGDLLDAAETAGFDVFVTADKNMRYSRTSPTGASPLSSSARRNGRS
jgi:hypothetical protein